MKEPTKYTLITGASSGIGRAIALRLACERNVILHGRDAGRLEETGAQCPETSKRLIWRFDLADPAGLETSLIGLLKTNDAVVDTFIHSAGMLTLLPLRSMTSAQMSELMNVNFLSAAQIVGVLVKKNATMTSSSGMSFSSRARRASSAPRPSRSTAPARAPWTR